MTMTGKPSQTYEQYLQTMKAYRFYPMNRKLWQSWQMHYFGAFLNSRFITYTRGGGDTIYCMEEGDFGVLPAFWDDFIWQYAASPEAAIRAHDEMLDLRMREINAGMPERETYGEKTNAK